MSDQEHQKQNHFLIAAFPAQGHINPALRLAESVIPLGVHVTFFTSVYGQRSMLSTSTSYPHGLTFAPFSHGYDDGCNLHGDLADYTSDIGICGSEALSNLVERLDSEGRPITCVICTSALPWAIQVAHKYNISYAFLWIQPATVFDIFYYYFNGDRGLILENINDPSYTLSLPGLPTLKAKELPSFILPTDTEDVILRLLEEQFDLLSKGSKSFQVLANTFDELEPEALKAVDKIKVVGIGPLIPSAYLDGNSEDYFKWLDTKHKSSVVYVSFGSISVLTTKQMEELARGLVDSGRPFLWVIRSDVQDKEDKDATYREILREEHKGMIVRWCSQVEVLNHPSVGCFVTHGGWNSTLETIVAGVPVVAAFPQWADQGTTGKLIEDVWKIGVRVRPNEEDEIVKSEEIVRCLTEVMEGGRGEELRRNAEKWKNLSREALKEGGSSHKNLRMFVEEVGKQV